MKRLGKTDDGGYLVELNEREAQAFGMLSHVSEGLLINYPYLNNGDDPIFKGDLADTFTVIRLWIENVDAVNRVGVAVERVREALGMSRPECLCGDECRHGE